MPIGSPINRLTAAPCELRPPGTWILTVVPSDLEARPGDVLMFGEVAAVEIRRSATDRRITDHLRTVAAELVNDAGEWSARHAIYWAVIVDIRTVAC